MAASFVQPVVCPVLIGRTSKLDVLQQRIHSASDGHGQTVLIAGEAGVGKSRLVAEAKAYAAARGFLVLQAACFPQDSACPYAPLIDLLRTRLAGRAASAIMAAPERARRAQPTGSLPSGTITFLFTDVEGSTQLWERHPDSMRQALARHDTLVETCVARFEGVVVRPRGEGDSRFAVFTRATDAVAAACALQQALHFEPWPTPTPLRVRVALHTGEADLRAGDYYGPAVNRCARLRASAHGGQTLLSAATWELVRDRLPTGAALRDLGEHGLKDIIRPEHVFELITSDVPADIAPLASLDSQRPSIAEPLPPQIGRAEEDPLAPVLFRLLPDLAPLTMDMPALPPLNPEQERLRLFAALTQFFAHQAARQPVLLIVEDLHWSDEGSLDFLLYLMRRFAAQPLLLIGTYRSDEVGARLGRWLAHLDREHRSQELRLAALTRDEVAGMLRAIFALQRPVRGETLDPIYALTEGNPFYVEEVLKSLVAAGDFFYANGSWDRKPIEALRIPHSLNDAVQQRVERLSADARRVLELAAVVGRRFDFALLQRLAHHDEDALLSLLKELIAAQLVVEESAEGFAFRHALTRQAIYAGLLARERAALHRTIAKAIERSYADALDPPVADLAYHYFEAGSWEQALEFARRAGARAQALGAPLAAVEQFTRALDAAGALGATPAPALYLARGQAYEILGDFEHAHADYEQGRHLAHDEQDDAAEWQSLLDLGQLWAGRDYQQTGVWFRRACDLAQTLNDPRLLAQSLNRLGNWHVNIGQSEAGLHLHAQALALFEAEDNRQGMADTLDLLGMANGLYGDMLSSVQWYDRAIELYRALGDSAGLSSALASRAMFSGGVSSGPAIGAYRSYDDCASDLAESLRLARQIDWLAGQAYAEYTAGQVFEVFGDFGAALAHARAARQIATSIEHRQWIAATYKALGRIFVALLAPDQAIHDLLAGLALAQALGSKPHVGDIVTALAQVYLLGRDLAQAEATLAAAMPREQIARSFGERRIALAWGELALAQGAPEQALRIAEQLIESAPGVARGPIPALLKLQGEALLALGHAGEAAQALETARRDAEAHGLRPMLWQILRALGHTQQRLGQRKAARQTFAAAREVIGTLAATINEVGLRDQFTQAALASLPHEHPPTPQRAEAERFGGLTERERAVAALIAQGQSNQEIATTLIVSKRTVETHVGNIMAKIGATTRTQVVAWAIGQGLVHPPS
jgi:class 3 adenylate cyclase/DNA-binding CsgD family transcriptional regulator